MGDLRGFVICIDVRSMNRNTERRLVQLVREKGNGERLNRNNGQRALWNPVPNFQVHDPRPTSLLSQRSITWGRRGESIFIGKSLTCQMSYGFFVILMYLQALQPCMLYMYTTRWYNARMWVSSEGKKSSIKMTIAMHVFPTHSSE